ncbi:MAG: PH domain-containing protein [bacterium]|nr:PH domain-containing protein [bacterium]
MSRNSLPFELIDGEKVIGEPNLHWTWILPTFIKVSIALAIYLSLVYLSHGYFFGTLNGGIISLLIIMGIVGYFVITRKKHHLSRFVITNYRLVDVNRHRLLHTQIYEVPYDHIQSVCALKSGFWGTLLNYGTLIISTAGEEGKLEIGQNHLARPGDAQSVILIARDEFLKNLGSYKAVLSQRGMQDNQSIQQLVQERKSTVGFAVSDEEDESGKVTSHSDSSYLVGMLSRGASFKKNVIKSLVEEIGSDGSPKGHRLVKTVTSTAHFKKKVIDDLEKELLS